MTPSLLSRRWTGPQLLSDRRQNFWDDHLTQILSSAEHKTSRYSIWVNKMFGTVLPRSKNTARRPKTTIVQDLDVIGPIWRAICGSRRLYFFFYFELRENILKQVCPVQLCCGDRADRPSLWGQMERKEEGKKKQQIVRNSSRNNENVVRLNRTRQTLPTAKKKKKKTAEDLRARWENTLLQSKSAGCV